jgi:hypothetical protein
LASDRKFSHFIFTFSKNNQLQNILTLYHINNFFIIFQIKKFTTIQNFFTFPYKFFLLYITFITSYHYSQKNSTKILFPLCQTHDSALFGHLPNIPKKSLLCDSQTSLFQVIISLEKTILHMVIVQPNGSKSFKGCLS